MSKKKAVENVKLYSQPNGPYKTVTFITLTPSIISNDIINQIVPNQNIQDENNFIKNGRQYFCKKTKTNFLINSDTELTENSLLFLARTSDILVFLISQNGLLESKMRLLKKHLPSYLFCIQYRDEKKWAKKFVEQNFGDKKIVLMESLFDTLSMMKIENTKVCDRPYFVPSKYLLTEEGIVIEGFMKKGLVSKNVICNGLLEFEVERIIVDGNEFDGGMLDHDDIIFERYKSIKDDERVENDEGCGDEMDIEEMSSEYGESSECKSSSVEVQENEVNLIHEFKDYKGIKNLSTCKFVTEEYPDYYKDIVFFNRFHELQRKIKKIKSKIDDNKMVQMKLKRKFDHCCQLDSVVFFNVYENEDFKTIYNAEFNAEYELNENENLVIDLGYKIIRSQPMFSYPTKSRVHKKKDTMMSGIMTFIGPMSFNVNKILIYRSNNNFLEISQYVGIGANIFYDDRVLLSEMCLAGYPHKIDKRYCTVKKMFNTKQEVMYYRNMALSTRDGNAGIIKKPIGTHGLFKAYFNKPVQHGNVITISLFKRDFPLYN